ncbi:MAG: glycosyltransferase family 2 protein [Prevotella sp.]|nr:glycosyltransferase family 2 protein [Prevotellaceae bacterium]MDY5343225.1 glycosyltransferase family 2 protein [Prevotella sp.]
MKISVVIVNYNVKYYVGQCIDSVRRALQGIDSEIIVVDNHSRDGSVDYLSKIEGVRIIESGHNLGFSKANNIAIRQSTAEYVLMLNPDTIVAEDAIRMIIDFADSHPQAGGIGVRMHNDWGTTARESRRGLPSPMTSFYKIIGLSKRLPQHRKYGRYYMGWLPWDSPSRIEVVSGACFLVRRKALDEVGLMDEDYFMYGEDIDLSYRLLKSGWENWFVPADIIHYKGESTQKTSFNYVHVFYNAMLIFMRKHYSHLSWLIIWPLQIAVYFIALLALMATLFDRMKKSLGFGGRYKIEFPVLYLEGSNTMKEKCRAIAMRKGLSVIDSLDDCKQNIVVRVFDPSDMSYADIIKHMSESANNRVRLGLYHNDKDIIITQMEVYG